tara:strand:+ start:2591 stop:2842 length:252 start_codon:yes stop_codon:yes gene_type:complete
MNGIFDLGHRLSLIKLQWKWRRQMLHVVYLQEKDDKHPILVAAFMMKSDAEAFMEVASLSDYYYLKETTADAWQHWSKIREEI